MFYIVSYVNFESIEVTGSISGEAAAAGHRRRQSVEVDPGTYPSEKILKDFRKTPTILKDCEGLWGQSLRIYSPT